MVKLRTDGVPRLGALSVNPAIEVTVPPRETPVVPIVTELLASAAFGILAQATASVGVVVLFVTVGTHQLGHDPALAMKLVTDPLPLLDPVIVQVVVPPEKVQLPAPLEKFKTKAPAFVLTDGTPEAGVE